MLQKAFKGRSVAHNPAVNAPDARLFQQVFPFPEKGVGPQGNGILRADGRVPAADNIDVAFQGTIGEDFPGVADTGTEAVIGPEGMQGRAGSDELAVGGRHHALGGVVIDKGFAAQLLHAYPEDRPRNGGLPGYGFHILLKGRLGKSGNGRQSPGYD